MALYTLTVDLLAETGSFERDLGKAARASERSARAMRQMQREMSDSFAQAARDAKVSVTSIDLSMATLAKGFAAVGGGALLGMFIAETVAAQNELAQLNAALKSTGQAAGFNSKQLTDMADKMAKATIQSSGEIVNAQTRLLSYTSIVGENFPRALQLAIDQSVRLGENITQSAETIGKALEYPTEGISALTKQGFRFTEQQKDMLASLVEGGRLAEARAMVMGVMEESYAGAGKAARETLGGALIGLKESFNDLLGSQAQSGGIAAATAAINSFAKNLDVVAAAAVPLGIGLGVFYAGGKLVKGITVLNGLWAANAVVANRAAVGMMGMVPATVRLTAAQTAARVAAQGLSSAYAMLGGPVGIAAAIATAAAGWWMVRESTAAADGALVDFNGTLDDTIEKFRELNKQQQAGEILRLQREMQSGYEGLTSAINQMVAVASTEIGGPRFKAYVKDVGDLRLQFQAGKVNADQFAASLASANTRLLEGAPAAARVNDKFVEQTASAATLGLKYEQQNRLLDTFIGASSGAEKQTDATTAALNRQVVASKAASDGINQHLKSLESSIDSQLVNLVRLKQGAEAAFMVDVGQKINAAGGVDKLTAEQRAAYNKQIAQGLSLIRQTEVAQKAVQAAKAGSKADAKEQKAATDALERYRKEAELAAAAMAGPLDEAMAKHLQNMAEYNGALAKGNIAQADANVLMGQSALEYAKVAAQAEQAMGGPELLIATMGGELAMLGKVGRARELYRRQLMNERDMRQELQKAVEGAGSKEELALAKGEDSYEQYERSMLAAADAAAALSLQVEEGAANVEAWANVVLHGVDGAADAMADFVASGLRDFNGLWDDLKDTAKQGLRDIARELLQQKLVIPIQTRVMGGISNWGSQGGFSMDSLMGLFGGNGSAGGGQNVGNLAGILSKGQGLFSGGTAAAGATNAYFGIGSSAGSMAGFGSNVAGFAGGGASAGAGAGAAGSTAAAAVPIIGWIVAGMMKNAELFDQGWDIANGESWAGKIATAGAVGLADKGFRGLGFNDKTASILSGSSIHAKLFGRSAPKVTGQGLTGSYGFGGFDGQSYADIKAKGGMFRSDKKWTQYGSLDPGIDRTFDMAARQVRGATTDLAKQLGVDLSGQLAGVKVSLGKLQLSADSAEAKSQLEAYLGDMTDRLFTEAVRAAGFGGQLDGYFEASDVFSALSASIALAVGNADQLGRALNSMEIEKVNKAVDYFRGPGQRGRH
ncbi:phage tail length tape measure family protein [Stenotrophomonas rhizophila]